MALKSWLASLKTDISGVSGVQAPIDAGLGRYVTDTADVSGVAGPGGMAASDTADTAAQNQTYQAEPAWLLGCTGDTADTCQKINADFQTSDAVATLTQSEPKRLCRQREPWLVERDGMAARVLAPAPNPDRWCYPHSSALNTVEVDTFSAWLARFTGKGMTIADGEGLADKLVIRDREGDDRRVCLECLHLSRIGSWRCGQWKRAGVGAGGVPAELVVQLQRCDGFNGFRQQ